MFPSNRRQAERIRPPRALFCDFPLGRPLGRPGDPAFQRRVLEAGFELLTRPAGPVLEDFPEAIHDESGPVACSIPPRHDPGLPPAVDEALALRAAFERTRARTGRTQVGRAVQPDEIADAARRLIAIAAGSSLAEAGFSSGEQIVHTAMDIRTYYEEAALALLDHVPAARSLEAWLYGTTEMGKLLIAVTRAINDADNPLKLVVSSHIVPFSYFDDWKSLDLQTV
jgi:hypothetical protein